MSIDTDIKVKMDEENSGIAIAEPFISYEEWKWQMKDTGIDPLD